MAQPFLSEIKIVSFGFAPKGWALCDGQLLPINQNQALFSLLGTTYGGDGRVNFGLPDLRGRIPFHMGHGHTLGERGGEAAHTLTQSEMPLHSHAPVGSNSTTLALHPAGNLWANANEQSYSTSTPDTLMNASPQSSGGGAIAPTGGSQAHDNMSPYLVLNFVIALQGIFPSQT